MTFRQQPKNVNIGFNLRVILMTMVVFAAGLVSGLVLFQFLNYGTQPVDEGKTVESLFFSKQHILRLSLPRNCVARLILHYG